MARPSFAPAALRQKARELLVRLYPWPSRVKKGREGTLRVLFLRPVPLGDTIVSLGPLRALAEARPEVRITLVGGAQAPELCEGLPYVHEHVEMSRSRWWSLDLAWALLRRPAFDVVIDAFPASGRMRVATPLVLAATRAPVRIGASDSPHVAALTTVVDGRAEREHIVDFLHRLVQPLTRPIDGRADLRPRLALEPDERAAADATWRRAPGTAPRILLNIAVGHWSRRWPEERYGRVLAHLRNRLPDARFVILGFGMEASASALAAGAGGISARTTVRQMLALVATADLVVTPDTSIGHVAAAFDRTVITLHPQNKDIWRPYQARGRAVFAPSIVTLQFLSVDAVTAAIDELLDEGLPVTSDDASR